MLCVLREGRDIVRLESLPRLRAYRLLGIKKTGEYTHFVRHQKQKLVPTGAFRPLTGSSSALRGRFCVFCIPIVLPHGTPPFRGSVRQDDRNAHFLCRPIVGLTPPKLPALGSNLRLHRGLYIHTDIVRLSWRLIIIPTDNRFVKLFSRIFSQKFVQLHRIFFTPIFSGKHPFPTTKYRFSQVFAKISNKCLLFPNKCAILTL